MDSKTTGLASTTKLLPSLRERLRAGRVKTVYCAMAIVLALSSLTGCERKPPEQEPFDSVRDYTGKLPVFPGCEGFGADTPAGRGGRVLRVTNLDSDGPGSLRAALIEKGPRVVVFEVGGVIDLTDSLVITEPFITVAGQTAPSPGITIIGAGLVVTTHDALVQHLRVRVGDRPEGPAPDGRDGISIYSRPAEIEEAYNVVIDHCSVSWALDEDMSTWNAGVHDVTIRQCIIAETLSHSLHPEGEHSRGLLVGDHTRRFSAIGNLMAHNANRNPQIKGDVSALVGNNLIYNPKREVIHFDDPENSGMSVASIEGNVFMPGPDTPKSLAFIIPQWHTQRETQIFEADNVVDDPHADLHAILRPARKHRVGAPLVRLTPLTMKPSSEVKEWVLATAGARPKDRDAADQRVVADVLNRTGHIIDTQDEVGGFPVETKSRRQLEIPANPDADDNGDGYTNLEEWLHRFSEEVEKGRG